jgi:hypothetical protein
MVKRRVLQDVAQNFQNAIEDLTEVQDAIHGIGGLFQFVHISQLDDDFGVDDDQSLKKWRADVTQSLSTIEANNVSTHWETIKQSPQTKTKVGNARKGVLAIAQDDIGKLEDTRQTLQNARNSSKSSARTPRKTTAATFKTRYEKFPRH